MTRRTLVVRLAILSLTAALPAGIAACGKKGDLDSPAKTKKKTEE